MKRFVVLLAVLLSGCGIAYQERIETVRVSKDRTAALSRDASFVIAVQGEGKYRHKVKRGSGGQARNAMSIAVSRHAKRVSTIEQFMTEADARTDAKRQNADYLIYLDILNWEERQTAWSGLPDRMEIHIRTIDAKNGRVVDDLIVMGNSKWATLGGDHVDDLLPKPFTNYADSIFGSASTKN